MSQTVIEVKADKFLNEDNSYYEFLLGESINIKAGSTIDLMDSIIDLGITSQSTIDVPEDMYLGIDFYIYENDIPKVPDKQGTPAYYQKRNIYIANNDVEIEGFAYPANAYIPNKAYGQKLNTYYPSCLPAFLCQRQGQREVLYSGTSPTDPSIVQDTMNAMEFTAKIFIKKGSYSKQKFSQLVNDGFNLINGSLTNQDKPAESKSNNAKPFNVSPVDFSQVPNNNSEILKSYYYKYSELSHTLTVDPDAWSDGTYLNTTFYNNDLNFAYWFCPIYTKTYPDYEVDEPYSPYIWYTTNSSGFMAGTTKFNLEYDTDSDLFYIDYLHSPILDKEQKEVVLITPVLTKYSNSVAETIGYKSASSLGGIFITRLWSNTTGDNTDPNTNFWQNSLGFAYNDDYREQINDNLLTKTTEIYYNTLTKVGGGGQDRLATRIIYKFVITYPDPQFFSTSTTTPLVPIQWLQQSNYSTNADDTGMSIITQDLPRSFQSIGNIPILGDQSAFQQKNPYYLIEVNINDVKNDNWRDKNSNYQIMNICGRTYTTGDYIQSYDDGSVQALILYEDINIDKISIKILNPDKTFATDLGTNTTIFLKITQPVVLEKK